MAPPKKKTRQDLEDENENLRKQVAQLQESASHKSEESFIPKPKGQAGRGDGYNLFEEMRVSSTASYNVIRNVVRVIGSAYLDLRLTWSKQDTKAKALARREIKRLVPILKYYHQAWPINAFLKQYLGSSAAKYRKDIQKLSDMNEVPSRQKTASSQRADEKSDAEDFVSFASDESETEDEFNSDNRSEVSDSGSEVSDSGSEVSDEIKTKSGKKPIRPLPKGKGSTNKKQAVEPSRETRSKNKEKSKETLKSKASTAGNTKSVKTGAKKSLAAGTGNKDTRLPLSDMTEEHENGTVARTRNGRKNEPVANANKKSQTVNAKKRKSDEELESRPAKQTRQIEKGGQALTEWPSHCPDELCEDVFPSIPSKRLAKAYKTYLAQKTAINALTVCGEIENDKKLPSLQQIALKNEWRIDIDFGSFANRIRNHHDEIVGLFNNEIVISASAAWKTFIRTLADHAIPLTEFNGLSHHRRFSILNSVTHCGYYGPRGVEKISEAIYATMRGKDRATIDGNLQGALSELIENHQDATLKFAGFWNSADGRSISLINFIEFVVTPHVANLLIQDDLQTTDDNANANRLRSRDIGDVFQYTNGDDSELENEEPGLPVRLRKIAKRRSLAEDSSAVIAESSNTTTKVAPSTTIKIPPRPRPRTGGKKGAANSRKSGPKQLTMSDFPPPKVKAS